MEKSHVFTSCNEDDGKNARENTEKNIKKRKLEQEAENMMQELNNQKTLKNPTKNSAKKIVTPRNITQTNISLLEKNTGGTLIKCSKLRSIHFVDFFFLIFQEKQQ